MKKFSKVLIIALGIIVLLAVEILIIKVGSRYEPEVTVIYARTAIKAKTEIKDEMLIEKKVPLTYVHKSSIRSKSDIVGKKAKTDIEAGEMILSGRIGEIVEMQEIPVVDKNNRLFTIEFKPDQANGWWLLVDQYVDIIYVPNPSVGIASAAAIIQEIVNDTGKEENIASFAEIDKNTGVIRINNIRVAAIIDDYFKRMNNEVRTGNPKYICFEVTNKQDEFLAWAKSNGRLEISVRALNEE